MSCGRRFSQPSFHPAIVVNYIMPNRPKKVKCSWEKIPMKNKCGNFIAQANRKNSHGWRERSSTKDWGLLNSRYYNYEIGEQKEMSGKVKQKENCRSCGTVAPQIWVPAKTHRLLLYISQGKKELRASALSADFAAMPAVSSTIFPPHLYRNPPPIE